ncbi:hypothetical protein BG011_008587 [Mortierella polycephala]|uniref:DUF676 domain-containing protein n=1 Tax=Mortierella polycephala TaxID=41804 RepID=A0A9P6PMQ5_9FUNG|nr:hypothetical protein BG011_008587 [Mortierella polycephala]
MATEQGQHSHTHEGVHLLILNHGLWGNAGHVKFLGQQFKKRFGGRILVYRAESNESSLTYDGVDVCGQRLVQEIHEVIRVIEAGGNIEDLKGQKNKDKKGDQKKNKKASSTISNNDNSQSTIASSVSKNSNSSSSQYSSKNNSQESLFADVDSKRSKKVTQFSFLGYSLGGLIGRFAIGLLDMEKFFDPVEEGGKGIEPMYFVTMATPHLGIRKPPESKWSRLFNYLSSRMLSRTGEQLQLIDDYILGKPILLVMSESEGVFLKALTRFKRRALYCNIRNDRSVPFWTASFSDADPFCELESVQIQYDSQYSSLIESFEPQDLETLAKLARERAAVLDSTTFTERAVQRLANVPWKRYTLIGVLGPILIPVWIVFATTTISYQGLDSRRRTKDLVAKSETLARIREQASTITVAQYRDDNSDNGDRGNEGSKSSKGNQRSEGIDDAPYTQEAEPQQHTRKNLNRRHSIVSLENEDDPDSPVVSHSYPHLKSIHQLPLLPVQIEISKNLNTLEWSKNIVHIESMNAHASIVVREKRFSNEGGIAAVQHAVDMFKEDGEDE